MRLFASYSRHDAASAVGLIRDLEHAHLSVWHDSELRGGDRWWQEILQQIRESDILLFLLSDNSLQSKPCQAELSYAQALGIPIVPIQIGPVDHLRTTPVADIQVVDYRERTVENGLVLLSAVQEAAAKRRPLPDPLPEGPPVPFDYLFRLGSAISREHLTPQEQADFIHQLQESLETESDETVRGDAQELLVALRHRSDVTYRNAQEIDRLIASLDASEKGRGDGAPQRRHRTGKPRADGGDRSHTGASPPERPPHPAPRVPRRPGRRALVVLGTVLGLLALGGLVFYLLPSGSGGPEPAATSRAPSATASQQPSSTPPPPTEPTGLFTSLAAGGGIGVSIVVDAGQARAYVCDGQQLEAWMSGTVTGNKVDLSGEDNASLTGTLNDQGMSGTISTTAGQFPFLAEVAEAPAGVYRAEIQVNGQKWYAGWAVLADGKQFGVVNNGSAALPAPSLNLADGTFQLNGNVYQAERVSGNEPKPTS